MKTFKPALAMLGALGCLALVATGPADAKSRKKSGNPPAAAPAAVPTLSAEQQRAAANAEQAKAAQAQAAENAANQQAYQDSLKARDEKIAREKAEYDAAMAKWKADTAACQAGDVSKCAKPN
jgi:fused signal recognition particle receptor